ncbi:MAG TPA: RNA polymerase sigma factor [Polyangiaceae bacterium]|nr:RNA polymerase sigma factor [Polyangiaceae bacterium]
MTAPNLQRETQGSWRRFLATYEPIRPELFKYCRYLTRSPWDAEDLTQDTLARAFVTLAQMGAEPPNPRAWLLRVASNLWIDRKRRERGVASPSVEPVTTDVDPRATREASATLLIKLAPQERAAVVLKDVFELSLEEIAEALGSTVGGIKAALHRGRSKLVDEAPDERETAPIPGALDAFCSAFNAGDLDALTSLLLDSAVVHVVGATTQYGPEAARRTVLWGMLFGVKIMVSPTGPLDPRFVAELIESPPRVEARFHRGRWLLLHWYQHRDGEAVRAFTTLELQEERVSELFNFFYNPDLLSELGAELGVPVRSNGYRWWRGEPE